jgi:hypothetical protein
LSLLVFIIIGVSSTIVILHKVVMVLSQAFTHSVIVHLIIEYLGLLNLCIEVILILAIS